MTRKRTSRKPASRQEPFCRHEATGRIIERVAVAPNETLWALLWALFPEEKESWAARMKLPSALRAAKAAKKAGRKAVRHEK